MKNKVFMIEDRWVITAKNCLTGEREEVSLPMERLEAIARCKEYIRASAMDEGRAFKCLRIKKYDPKQLTIW